MSNSNVASTGRRERFAPRLVPVQAARDHQVQNEPEIAVETDRDALAEPPQCDDAAAGAILR